MESLLTASTDFECKQNGAPNGFLSHDSGNMNGHVNGVSNGDATGVSRPNNNRLTPANNANENIQSSVDWAKQASIRTDTDWYCDTDAIKAAKKIAMTGACTMAGAHFLYLMLTTSSIIIHCLAVDAESEAEARSQVISALEHWKLAKKITPDAYERIRVHNGKLAHPTLGLSTTQVSHLDKSLDSIYHLDSEVSLLKNYEAIRAGNVGAIQFLISLAHGDVGNTKSLHYLSTWGVPHLQAWHDTQLSSPDWETAEKEMTNMIPGDNTLGYLKCRWVCESLLYQAAHRGIPVNIFRSSMCAGSPGAPLNRTDINRRILEGSLQTGLVPNFSSSRGGGMSWITAEFLAGSIKFLSQRHAEHYRKARIYHIVGDTHVPYTALPQLLGPARNGKPLKIVSPEEWFEAMRASGNMDMSMQAEVLERWCEAGWVPFGVEAADTLRMLKTEYGLVPQKVDREMLMGLVVGEEGF